MSSGQLYPQPQNTAEALQRAIPKWIRSQRDIWDEAMALSVKRFAIWSTLLRIMIIVLAGSITTMSDIDFVPRTVITIIGGVLTVLAGIEGYLKLADRHSAGENQKRELLAERDKWRYQWMVDVELQPDDDEALEKAKILLQDAPKAFNELLVKYASRKTSHEPDQPK